MTELTRRQMRELERSGAAVPAAMAAEPPIEAAQSPAPIQEVSTPQQSSSSVITEERPLTRRELRERAEAGAAGGQQAHSLERASALTKSLLSTEGEYAEDPKVAQVAPEVQPERRRLAPLPPVGQSRRATRATQPEVVTGQSTDYMEVVDVEIPEDGLRGANYLGEPSTQSIVLDVAPEAMSLSVSTGEIFTTGSIAILPDTTGATTGTLDGMDLDQEEAVTGVISIVDPVSARDLIDERSPLGVVPSGVLRKGWWRPWAVGAFSIAMAITAILASITIFNALGD